METTDYIVRSEPELRQIVGLPGTRSLQKELGALDAHSRAFIERSPLLLLGTCGRDGRCDVSPKGDAPGFVHVENERRLFIPDRPGNKRLDGMINVIENPYVGLIFLVPGRDETLRVNGRGWITREPQLLLRLAMQGKAPLLAIGVEVEQCFLHCAKAFIRSALWNHERWPSPDALPSLACMLFDQIRPKDVTLQDYERDIEEGYATRLY
jgi:PPOX class probable FMN-dependent enzyme